MTNRTIHGLYCIWDRKAAYALPVMAAQNDALAMRSFTEVIMTSETPVSQFPADFDLLKIGEIQLETAQVDPIYPPQLLVNGLVSLQDAQQQRKRYQAVLQPEGDANTSTEAS